MTICHICLWGPAENVRRESIRAVAAELRLGQSKRLSKWVRVTRINDRCASIIYGGVPGKLVGEVRYEADEE